MSAGGDVFYGVPVAGVPDVHELIVSGQLEKAFSAISKGTGDRDGVRGDNRIPPIPKLLIKSKTWSGHPISKRMKFRGLDISIENAAGTYRTGKDPDGNEWRSLLHFDYGYIRGTTGVDKDHVDCFIGPEPNSDKVFVIHQKDVKTGAYDEDKCMLGWYSKTQAIADYLLNYDRKDMLMGCTTMTFDEFKPKVLATKDKPRMIKSKIKAHTRKLKSGKVVGVTEHIRHKNIGGIGDALRVQHILSDNIDFELWVSSKGSVVRMYDRDGKVSVLHQRYPSGMEKQAREKFDEVTKYTREDTE